MRRWAARLATRCHHGWLHVAHLDTAHGRCVLRVRGETARKNKMFRNCMVARHWVQDGTGHRSYAYPKPQVVAHNVEECVVHVYVNKRSMLDIETTTS